MRSEPGRVEKVTRWFSFREWDRYLLVNFPEIWNIRLHYLLAWAPVVLALSVILGFLTPMRTSFVLESNVVLEFAYFAWCPVFLYWAYLQVRDFRRLPWIVSPGHWRYFLLYFVALLLLNAPPFVYTLALEAKARMLVSVKELEDELPIYRGNQEIYLKAPLALTPAMEADPVFMLMIRSALAYTTRLNAATTPNGVQKLVALRNFYEKYGGPITLPPSTEQDQRRADARAGIVIEQINLRASSNFAGFLKYHYLQLPYYPVTTVDYVVGYFFVQASIAMAFFTLRAVSSTSRLLLPVVIYFGAAIYRLEQLVLRPAGLGFREWIFFPEVIAYAIGLLVMFRIRSLRRGSWPYDVALIMAALLTPFMPLIVFKYFYGSVLVLYPNDLIDVDPMMRRRAYMTCHGLGMGACLLFAALAHRVYSRWIALPR